MSGPLRLSAADARRLLLRWHFAPTDLAGAFERLGGVQFDPLKPLGCNHDLVLQARVPGYRVGDWRALAYRERAIVDAWDKQASLVLMRHWPQRRVYHGWHRSWWDERVFAAHPEAVDAVLAELAERGPLASTDFEHQVHVSDWEGSWYGPKLTKHVLRALWHTGRVVTHHRVGLKHVYDLAERVVPAELLAAPEWSEEDAERWLLVQRHRAAGLLRPNAPRELWSMPTRSPRRRALIRELVAAGELVALEVDGLRLHAHPEALATLDQDASGAGSDPGVRGVRFVAPLDQLLWDRTLVERLFGFHYVWEVYKPAAKRRWGYYVLPVMDGEGFVARFDARLRGHAWHLHGWWWEPGVTPDAALLGRLEAAAARFARYLGAREVRFEAAAGTAAGAAVPEPVRAALRAGVAATHGSDHGRESGRGAGDGGAGEAAAGADLETAAGADGGGRP